MLRFNLCTLQLDLIFRRAALAVDSIFAAVAAILVVIGLWTPIAGLIAALCLVWNAFSQLNSLKGDPKDLDCNPD